MLKRIALHIIFWLTIAGINIGFTIRFFSLNFVILSALFALIFQMLVFYINSYVLFPQFFSLEKSARFIIITVLFVLIVAFCQTVVDQSYFAQIFHKGPPPDSDFAPAPGPAPSHFMMTFTRIFFWLALIGMISTVYMMQDKIRQQIEHTQQIKAEKLDTELKLLKAQINPHFIFNALNNIYSLSYCKSNKTPESVLQLSQMLRYVIEDCQNEHVSLNSEIEYIKNYIAFQKMKSPKEQNIKFDYSQADGKVTISPMLFIPFIENAFKYSKIEEFSDAYINIKLATTANETIFRMRNSIPSAGHHRPGAGTGIHNVKKRLDILFPQKYCLEIDQVYNQFNVELVLKKL